MSSLYDTSIVLIVISEFRAAGLKVVCNEMKGGSETGLSYSYSFGTHVIGVCLNFNGDVVF